MSFQDAAFLPSRASFYTTLLKIVVWVMTSRPLHVLNLWLGVSKGILPVTYFLSNSLKHVVIIRRSQS